MDKTSNKSMQVDSDYDSVILIDDSVIESCPTNNSKADESCFIIDVEPNADPEGKSFYKYSLYEDVTDNDTTHSEANKTIKEVFVDSGNLSSCSSKFENVQSNCDINNSSAESGFDSNPTGPCPVANPASITTGQENTDKPQVPVVNLKASPEALVEQVNKINNIVNEMNEKGFFGSRKRRFDNSTPTNKRFARDAGESKPESWSSLKKRSNPKKSHRQQSAQNRASQRLLNKMNDKSVSPKNNKEINKNNENNLNSQNSTEDRSVYVEDSDSDVEFVDAFNPADRLIELSESDSDASVIIQDPEPPPSEIALPSSWKKRKTSNVNPVSNTGVRKRRTKQIKRKEKLKKAKEVVNEKAALRPIVIDGCNVGYGHSKVQGMLSVEGIKIVYDYFHSRGHEVKAFLPQFRLFSPKTSNNQLLQQMERDGIVVLTPGRKVGDKYISSYDDRFILEYATLKGAIVISRDNFRDLYEEKEEFRETIRDRILQYTFVDDLIMFPEDPLGRKGPSLSNFLRFPLTPQTNKQNQPSTSKT